jgi:Tol biopolymer transport system component
LVLTPGSRVGVYEVTAQIGEGGMGQVYRARDTTLNRDIALKVLPEAVAHDSDRLARFTREARTLAALNHPNIAHIHGLEESSGVRALVMEFVEGEDLAERIAQGAVRVDEALPIARQIAEALEAAHEQGIIHRDLKPANIRVRPDGTVKVLDFGLAKALAPEWTGALPDVLQSPTITSPAMTQMGVILGTAAYMSPEQARGRAVDKRADIWAFGCVLYEMLTAKRAFDGDSIVDVLGAVSRLEPDLEALPPEVPSRVRRVLQLCLRKDVRQRAQAMGDVRLALDGAFETTAPAATGVDRRAVPGARLAWAACALAVLAAVALSVPAVRHWREAAPSQVSGRFNILLPQEATFALSPSGRLLAFTSTDGGPRRLWIRALDSLDPRPMPGTDGADLPFWSPDEEHVAFFAQGKLKKIGVTGGPAETLCDAPTPRGGTWNRDGVIVFAPNIVGGLFRVSGDGGAPVAATTTGAALTSHRYPEFIAGGNRFLFVSDSGAEAEANGLFVGTLDGAAPIRIQSDMSRAVYVPAGIEAQTGVLLFKREAALMALPFDTTTFRATAGAVPVAQDVGTGAFANFGAFAASHTGVLVYRSFTVPRQTLTWIDRSTGRQIATKMDPQPIESMALSRDDSQVVLTVRPSQNTSDLWIHDLKRGVPTRFTFGPGRRWMPVWSPDGRSLVFANPRGPTSSDFFRKPSSGGGAEERIAALGSNATPMDISPDGKLLVYSITDPKTKDDLWILPLQDQQRTPTKYLDGAFEERHAQFSPDGRRIAYSSDETGVTQIYVQPVPATGAKRQISTQGGTRPRWRRDGKEIYYLSAEGKLMAVPVRLDADTLEVGAAERLFDLSLAPGNNRAFLYAPSNDGQRFLTSVLPDGSTSLATVWMNWMAGLGK